jgi:5,5'-dehydrodivanillate O-demethylase
MADLANLFRTGPNTLGGRYMRTLWHPIIIAAELKPGWAKPVQILGEKFTLYRGESGTPHLTAFRCAHRGLQLSVGWIEGDSIRCRFHGWKYDGSGQCVEVPTEDESSAKTVRLRTYPVREYLGLIFAYIGEGDAPEFSRYPDLNPAASSGSRPTRAPVISSSTWKTIRCISPSRTASPNCSPISPSKYR